MYRNWSIANYWMNVYLYTAHITYRLMAVYNSIEWDRPSACESASGCRYQLLHQLIVERTSDVMTQTRLRQTNWNGGWFWRFLKGQKRVFLKHLWNKNFAYIPCISLRTCLCWLSLAGISVICILFLDFVRSAIGSVHSYHYNNYY